MLGVRRKEQTYVGGEEEGAGLCRAEEEGADLYRG